MPIFKKECRHTDSKLFNDWVFQCLVRRQARQCYDAGSWSCILALIADRLWLFLYGFRMTYLKTPIPPGSSIIDRGVSKGYFSHRLANARRRWPCEICNTNSISINCATILLICGHQGTWRHKVRFSYCWLVFAVRRRTHKHDVRGLLSVHVRTLNTVNLPDELVETIRDLLSWPWRQSWANTFPQIRTYDTHSPPSHPSRQMSHGRSRSSPCSFLLSRISFVKRPSYFP